MVVPVGDAAQEIGVASVRLMEPVEDAVLHQKIERPKDRRSPTPECSAVSCCSNSSAVNARLSVEWHRRRRVADQSAGSRRPVKSAACVSLPNASSITYLPGDPDRRECNMARLFVRMQEPPS